MRRSTAALAALLVAAPALPHDGAASDPAAFLRLPTDARLMGLGQAQSTVAEGPDALAANPAGIAWQPAPGLKTTSGALGLDRSHIFLGATYPFGFDFQGWEGSRRMRLALGAGLTAFKIANIEERSSYGLKTGTFDDSEQAYHIAGGFKATDSFSLGANGTILKQRMQSNAGGYTIDVGALWRQTTGWGRIDTAYVMKSVKGYLDWELHDEGLNADFAYRENLRSKHVVGFGYVPNAQWRLALDFVASDNESGRLHLGSEWQILPQFHARAGINSYDPTLGFGYEWGRGRVALAVDYAFHYAINGPAHTHWFTIGFKFLPGEPRSAEPGSNLVQ